MAIHQEVVDAASVLDARPYMDESVVASYADGHYPDGQTTVPLLLTKQEAAQVIISLMTMAVEFDKGGVPEGAVDALDLAGRVGDQAFTEVSV